jgi:hypothetical protein
MGRVLVVEAWSHIPIMIHTAVITFALALRMNLIAGLW